MADCNDNIQKRGSGNPIQSKIIENNHGSSGGSTGDNTISDVTCDSTVSVGNIVRLNGSTFINALADGFTNSKAIGICVSKTDPTTCDVQVTGFTDTIFAGLTSETNYFLSDSTAGAITSTPPTASGSYVIRIGTAYETNKIIINIERIVNRA
jgi:hypothetical protein